MLSVVREYKDYSVLGHMDLIARYDEKGVYPFEKIKPIVEEILQVVIADGKGLEVNTSSYRYGLSDTDAFCGNFKTVQRAWRKDRHNRERQS